MLIFSSTMPANPSELDPDIVDEESADLPEAECMLTVTAGKELALPDSILPDRPNPENAENYRPEYNSFSCFPSKSPLDQQQRRRGQKN